MCCPPEPAQPGDEALRSALINVDYEARKEGGGGGEQAGTRWSGVPGKVKVSPGCY